jgi:hypothetical protein
MLGTPLARNRPMLARTPHDENEPLSPDDRPTIPGPAAPRESGVQLAMVRMPASGATVDIVVCDLSRDPRSEEFWSSSGDASAHPPQPPRRLALARRPTRTVNHARQDAAADEAEGDTADEVPRLERRHLR